MSKLKGAVTTLRNFATMLGVSRERAHQIAKAEKLESESPCSRCGTVTTLIKQSDANRIKRDRDRK